MATQYPPQAAFSNVQTAVTLLYAALQTLPATATGNIAAIGGAIESLQGLLTSWMITGEA